MVVITGSFFCFFFQIAALQARLRSAEEDVGAARREGLLEGQAKSLAQATAAGKNAGLACAKAEAMQERCAQQARPVLTVEETLFEHKSIFRLMELLN